MLNTTPTFSWKINVVSEDYATIDTGTAPIGGLLQVPAEGQIPIGVSPYACGGLQGCL